MTESAENVKACINQASFKIWYRPQYFKNNSGDATVKSGFRITGLYSDSANNPLNNIDHCRIYTGNL